MSIWFSRSKKAPIVDLAVPSSYIQEQDPLRSDPRRFDFHSITSGKVNAPQKDQERIKIKRERRSNPLDLASLRIGSPNPDAELDKILLEITDLVSEKFNDPSTVGDFMVDLRACAEGPAAATREVVTALLGQQNLTKENFMSLRDAIVARLLSYQINYNDHAPQSDQRPAASGAGLTTVPLAENQRKTSPVTRAPSRAPPNTAVSAPPRPRSAARAGPSTRTRLSPHPSSVSAPAIQAVRENVQVVREPKTGDFMINIESRAFNKGALSFSYYQSESAYSLSLPPPIPDHRPSVGDVYLHKNTTKVFDKTQVWVLVAEGDWINVTKVLGGTTFQAQPHPNCPDMVLILRKSDGTPNWVTTAYAKTNFKQVHSSSRSVSVISDAESE